MKLSKKKIQSFQKFIFVWWEEHKRDLPWRHTHDPYRIMVSEVMLQQTQVLRVLPKYAEFIEAFPTVTTLAKAKTSDVIKLWKGMGYNRRALYLRKAAEAVTEKYNGIFPGSEKELLQLPGIGKYTARAILVFAYKKDVSMVDTNIRQIITHFFFRDKKQPEHVIQNIADQLVPKGKSWEWHQALMDYNAALPRNPKSQIPNLKKKTIPFQNSNRFYRGRIMDLLREREWKEEELLSALIKTYGKPTDYLQAIIHGLMKDGLLICTDGILTLPI